LAAASKRARRHFIELWALPVLAREAKRGVVLVNPETEAS
jgi:hypothetical protein